MPILALVALALGIVAGSWIVRYPAVHRVTGRIFQRGELLALAGQRGIFEADVQARAQQKQFCSGMTDKPLDSTEKIAVRDEVIAAETLRVVAGKLDDSDVAGESPIWNINLATNANFVPPWVAATFRNRNSDGWWQRRSAANDGLKSKSLRGWPCLTRKCSNIFSSTKLSSLNRCEFVPVTFSWLRQRGRPRS